MPSAALDEQQTRLARQIELPLRWDNIEGPPAWVSGPKPHYRWRDGAHVVRLKPGEVVTVRVPRQQWLRLYRPNGALAPDEVELAFSDGSGLYTHATNTRSEDGRSLLAQNFLHAPALARVRRPAKRSGAVELALLVSRQEPLGTIAPYRTLVPLPTTEQRLRRADEAQAQRYWLLKPETPLAMALTGPARFALENCLAYPPAFHASHQAYTVLAQIDGLTPRELRFETGVQNNTEILVDGLSLLAGRLESGYFEIPPGKHRLRLDTTAPLHARLLRQDPDDYLLPGINAPHRNTGPREDSTLALPASPWNFDDQTLRRLSLDPNPSPAVKERVAQRLVRDNARRDNSMLGVAILRQSAASRPDYPAGEAVADEFEHYSFHRDLLPANKVGSEPQYFAWFTRPRLQESGDDRKTLILAAQHLDDALDRVAGAYFTSIPAAGEPIQTYSLPPRATPSGLRLIVDHDHSASGVSFFVQLDDRPPIRLETAAAQELPATDYAPTPPEAALALLRERNPLIAHPTLDGPFTRARVPAPRIRAGVTDLPLAPEIRQVRVWRDAAQSTRPLRLALQCQAARAFTLSETEYLQWESRLPRDKTAYGALLQALAKVRDPTYTRPSTETPIRELENHWSPLLRSLQSQAKFYTAGLDPKPNALPLARPLEPDVAQALLQQAQRKSQEAQWLPALEIGSRLIYGTTGAVRRSAQLARAHALFALGENFLAVTQLRGLSLYSPDPLLRTSAMQQLGAYYQETQSTEDRYALAATAALQEPTLSHLQDLFDAALADGRYELALMIGAALPASTRPAEGLLRAAFHLDWMQVFEKTLPLLSDPQQRALWRGHEWARFGDFVRAREAYESAGRIGEPWAEALRFGLDIRQNWDTQDALKKQQAVGQWASYQARHPGPVFWREEAQSIVDYAGTETPYAQDLDLFARYYRTDPDRPVRLRLAGPIRIKIETRVVHPPDNAMPIDTWLTVREQDSLRLLAVNHSLPTPDRISVNKGIVGTKTDGEFDFGPGLHEVELASANLPMLLRVFLRRPELPLGVLPPISPEHWQAWSDGPALQTAPPERQRCETAPQVRAFCPGSVPAAPIPIHPLVHDHRGAPSTREEQSYNVGISKASFWQTPDWAEAQLLAQGKPEQALAMPLANDSEALIRRMSLLVWLAEQPPAQPAHLLAVGEDLAEKHPRIPEIQALLSRLARDANWTPLTDIKASAGLRFVSLTHWQPESPDLRVRKSLLRPLDADEQFVSGSNRFVMLFDNLAPTRVVFHLRNEDPSYLAPTPMQVYYQIDEGRVQIIELPSDDSGAHIEIGVTSGKHAVYVGIKDPISLQYLRIRAQELRPAPPLPNIERPYHVATQAEPLRVSVTGPAWVRIDEHRAGSTDLRYRLIGAGRQELLIHPAPEQTEALLRLSLRGLGPPTPPPQPRPSDKARSVPAPPPLAFIPSRETPQRVRLIDHFALGGQEDGTWSFSTGVHRRLNTQEDRDARGGEQFVEMSATHRYFAETWYTYFESTALGRMREFGGPTLGLRESIAYYPTDRPWTLRWNGSLFVQQPDDSAIDSLQRAAFPSTNLATEWSGAMRASLAQRRELSPKTAHQAEVSFFARHLSLTPCRATASCRPERIDQDVFTPFKEQHRWGLELSDTLTHRPWLDTLWSLSGSVVGNENFTPDHLSFNLGWQQLIGAFQVNASYRSIVFLPDNDRAKLSTRDQVTLEINWQKWLAHQDRIELGLSLTGDSLREDFAGMLVFAWHFSEGRAYRDFRPGSVDFMDIKQRRIPGFPNNRIEALPDE